MDTNEIRILNFCRDGFTKLAPLENAIPAASLYRKAKRLCGRKLLIHRKKKGYQTTKAGLIALKEPTLVPSPAPGRVITSSRMVKVSPSGLLPIKNYLKITDDLFNRLLNLYSPLRRVPSVYHQSQILLTLGNVSDRFNAERDGHYLSQLQVGHTLRWKSSWEEFCLHMLGKNPAKNLIDLAIESGLSLWLRKGAAGQITMKREILDESLLAFENYHLAKPEVRAMCDRFWSGRLNVPLENTILTIRPVTLISTNPKNKNGKDIAAKLGLDEATVRRLIILDLDRIEKIRNLMITGPAAVKEAKTHTPLDIKKPLSNCEGCREEMVDYITTIFEYGLIDVEGLLGIARGFTGYGFTPEESVRLVVYLAAFSYQTLDWINPQFTKPTLQIGAGAAVTASEEQPEANPAGEGLAVPITSVVQGLEFNSEKRVFVDEVNGSIQMLEGLPVKPEITRAREDLNDCLAALKSTKSEAELSDLKKRFLEKLKPRTEKFIKENNLEIRRREILGEINIKKQQLPNILKTTENMSGDKIAAELERLGCGKKQDTPILNLFYLKHWLFFPWRCPDNTEQVSWIVKVRLLELGMMEEIVRQAKDIEALLPFEEIEKVILPLFQTLANQQIQKIIADRNIADEKRQEYLAFLDNLAKSIVSTLTKPSAPEALPAKTPPRGLPEITCPICGGMKLPEGIICPKCRGTGKIKDIK